MSLITEKSLVAAIRKRENSYIIFKPLVCKVQFKFKPIQDDIENNNMDREMRSITDVYSNTIVDNRF